MPFDPLLALNLVQKKQVAQERSDSDMVGCTALLQGPWRGHRRQARKVQAKLEAKDEKRVPGFNGLAHPFLQEAGSWRRPSLGGLKLLPQQHVVSLLVHPLSPKSEGLSYEAQAVVVST